MTRLSRTRKPRANETSPTMPTSAKVDAYEKRVNTIRQQRAKITLPKIGEPKCSNS